MSNQIIERMLSQARSALEPSDEDRRRVHQKVIAAIGTAGVVTAVATSAANASGSGAGGVWGSIAAKATALKLSIATLIIGGAAGLVATMNPEPAEPTPVVAVLPAVQEPSVSPIMDKVEVEEVSAPPLVTVSSEKVALDATGTPAMEASPKSVSPRKRAEKRNVAVAAAKPKIENDMMLFKELTLIRKASTALRNDRHKEAIRVLAEYDREIRDGVMTQERDGLRVLALCAQGRSTEARRARAKFLKRTPNSPLAVRIEERCAEMENKDE